VQAIVGILYLMTFCHMRHFDCYSVICCSSDGL